MAKLDLYKNHADDLRTIRFPSLYQRTSMKLSKVKCHKKEKYIISTNHCPSQHICRPTTVNFVSI